MYLECRDLFSRPKMVFEVLNKAKLTLKLSKYHFGYGEVTYLRFMLSKYGIRPGEQKIQTLNRSQIHIPDIECADCLVCVGFSDILFHICAGTSH